MRVDGDVQFRHAFTALDVVDGKLDGCASAFTVAPLEVLDLRVQAFTDFDDAGGQRLDIGIEDRPAGPDSADF